MEKNVISDGTYKFIYKLPSNSVLEFDFSLKKDENFESVLYENFEQEKIPKILLTDINILMRHFLYEERRMKKNYIKDTAITYDKNFIQKIINDWNGMKTFQNHLEFYNKHITQTWQKLVLIKFYNQTEKLYQFRLNFKENFGFFLSKKETDENDLRNKQEKEMQDANLKNLQLELIVNRHITELNKFAKEYKDKYILFKNEWRENYLKVIEDSFQNFIENLDQSSIIYNSDNKIVQIKFTQTSKVKNLFSIPFDSKDTKSTKSVKSSKSNELKQKNSNNIINPNFAQKDKNLIFNVKTSFGLFNKNKLNFYTIRVTDHIENNIKEIYGEFHFKDIKNKITNLSRDNNADDCDDMTINDILKSSDTFGENIFALVNLFQYDKNEMKIIHLFDNLNYHSTASQSHPPTQLQNELFFDNFTKMFNKIEDKCNKGSLPSEFDFFISKHEGLQSFDLLINIFSSKEKLNEEDFNSVMKIIIYFANVYKINILIIPLEKLIDKFFKINKFSDFKNFTRCKKIIINQIKNSMISIIKSGIKIYLKNVIFSISQSFMIGFDKSKSVEEFKIKLNQTMSK